MFAPYAAHTAFPYAPHTATQPQAYTYASQSAGLSYGGMPHGLVVHVHNNPHFAPHNSIHNAPTSGDQQVVMNQSIPPPPQPQEQAQPQEQPQTQERQQ